MKIICLLLIVLATQTAAAEPDSKRQQELVYFVKHDCGSCHGMTLKGGLGPSLLPQALAGKPDSLLISTILQGRPDTAMPPWNPMLSHDDVSWLVKQLKSGRIYQIPDKDKK